MQRSENVGVRCYVIDTGGLLLGRWGEESQMEIGVRGAERAGG